ncbi:conjugal transfer protein [Mycolicibacterium sphagni]|uniref:Conjugal transfer protein n=1 Tax=Mycolicibacterium sphagni TaxID=1786 RepID=A0ABX2JXS2_9MYCO|nr:conjugal transfer protein [Mycolicibacterium sphagni]NTY62543.1 conjugal transfer protein [Mycolicibacterium sphagni]
MQLTQTWRRRLTTTGRGGAKAVVTILVVCSVISGASTLWRWVFPPDSTPVAETARSVGNETALVESYAIDCVTVLLTASSSRAAEVARCFPSSTDMSLPTTSPLIVTAQAASATFVGQTAPGVSTYGVIVAVTEQSYTNAPPVRSYYQLPVSVYNGGAPRAMAKPARRDPPPPGVDVTLDYPVTITNDATLAAVITGFITCYLTDANGLERFITVDSGLGPLRAYSSTTVTSISAQHPAPQAPSDGTELRVWVTVSARAADYTITPLEYPLTLRATGGAWSVAGIDVVPAIDPNAPPTPVAATAR